MKVIITGLPYFVNKLVLSLSAFDKANSYVGLDMSRGILYKVRYLLHLLNADIVYSIGGFAGFSRAVLLAFLLKKKYIMHWVGTDVTDAARAFESSLKYSAITGRVAHFSEAPWLKDELSAIGIDAPVLPIFTYKNVHAKLEEFPEKFTILSYVGSGREDFYGMDKIVKLAKDYHDIEILICGISASKKSLPPNIRLLGWVDDMCGQYKNCVLFLRLVKHDGLSFSVLEALAAGRYVGYSYKLENTFLANDYFKLKNLVSCLHKYFKAGHLPLNYSGSCFVRENYDEQKILRNLIRKFQEIKKNNMKRS